MESVKVSQVEVSSGLLSTASLLAMTASPCTLAQGDLLAWQDMSWGEGQTTGEKSDEAHNMLADQQIEAEDVELELFCRVSSLVLEFPNVYLQGSQARDHCNGLEGEIYPSANSSCAEVSLYLDSMKKRSLTTGPANWDCYSF